ncbi:MULTISPECIES: LLM class flavin-dependent oxidoreductase [unclassified Beijerinckia]|uniref:LLM class flavin-dependent oxidoreductase n=1 Tax=unclassified Beijerinckia TaxID=2638183 RepID=UPI00147FFB94|nr:MULTISPECIES: LLM class flavin-dependent oxidoreductase [unclassified Beijerinckia]
MPSLEIARQNPDVLELDNHILFAQAIENVGLDFALIADGYAPASEAVSRTGFQDPSTNATILSVPMFLATQHLGIISTMHTTFLHPVVIARLGAHLDWISGGRWGWNIVNGFRDHEARLFGMEKKVDGYALAQEAVDIASALWVKTPETVTFEGQYFKVDGKMRRPVPQMLPLLVSAAASAQGLAFAATNCDYLFTSALTKAVVQDTAVTLRKNAEQLRKDDPPRILILADILIRDTPGTAQQVFADLLGSTDPEAQKTWASHLSKIGDARPNAADIMSLVGTADDIAEQIIELHRDCDLMGGFALRMLLWGPEEARRLPPVLAQLQKAGIWVPPATRDHCW